MASRLFGMRAMQTQVIPQQMRMYSMLGLQMRQAKPIFGFNAIRAFSIANPPSNGLYIQSVRQDITQEQLTELLSKYGEIERISD